MTNTVDLLQIKIEKAKRELPVETANAIASVDWRAAILGLREKKGYTFEQLGDLELETELLLCGLVSPEAYPGELEKRMGISGAQANELVNEMNGLVFRKIREELIKNTERKKIFQKNLGEQESQESHEIPTKRDTPAMPKAQTVQTGKLEIETSQKPSAHPVRGLAHNEVASPQDLGGATSNGTHPILAQKLSGNFQTKVVETEHTLDNLTPSNKPSPAPKIDPYREVPE